MVLVLLGGPEDEPFDAVEACRRGEGVFGVCIDRGRQVVAILEEGKVIAQREESNGLVYPFV
jgi:hypothetical protein